MMAGLDGVVQRGRWHAFADGRAQGSSGVWRHCGVIGVRTVSRSIVSIYKINMDWTMTVATTGGVHIRH
jgi:hypothetical protein